MRRHFATTLYRAKKRFYPSARPAPQSANPFLSPHRTGPHQTAPTPRRKTDTGFYSSYHIHISPIIKPISAKTPPRRAAPKPTTANPFTFPVLNLPANGQKPMYSLVHYPAIMY